MSEMQLVKSGEFASDFGESLGRTTRVVGWYHSHPNITIPPSHVDIGTQGGFELMDRDFVGIIVGPFHLITKNDMTRGRTSLIAFQSKRADSRSDQAYENLPLSIMPAAQIFVDTIQYKKVLHGCLTNLCRLQKMIGREELSLYKSTTFNIPTRDTHREEDEEEDDEDSDDWVQIAHDPLRAMYNASVYNKGLLRLLNQLTLPLLHTLEQDCH